MKRLPKWCITDKFPALYDTESATAIEQTAKLYGAISELIDEYNNWVDKINAQIEAFENAMEKDYEVFKVAMRQEFQDFIDIVDLKMQAQDKDIADAINYMKTNLIYFVHGTTTDNASKLCSGWKEAMLNDLGREQAENLGKVSSKRGDMFDVIFTSDLKRAVEYRIEETKKLKPSK